MRIDLLSEARAIFNDVVLLGDTELGRLVGFGEDIADCYYIAKMWDVKWIPSRSLKSAKPSGRGNIMWFTAVAPCISLRGIYSRYDQLDRVLTLNGCGPEVDFLMKSATREDNIKTYGLRAVLHWEKLSGVDKPRGSATVC